MDIKKAVAKIMASEEFAEARKIAVEKSHGFLNRLGETEEEVSPLILTLFLSHTFSHVLLSAPEKKMIKEMLTVFLADLDFAGLLNEWEKRQEEDDVEETEIHTVH